MKRVHIHNGATWIDLENPNVDEVAEIAETYRLDRVTADDLLSATARHRVEFNERYANLVLHFPSFKDAADGDAAFEFDIVVGRDYVITAHYRPIPSLEKLATDLEGDHPSSYVVENPRNELFFGILMRLLSDFDLKLTEVDHWVRETEKNMFAGKERVTIFELSEASRHLTDFRKISAVYPEVFETLEEKGDIFDEEFMRLSRELIHTFEKIRAKLDVLAEAVRELRDTNDALLSTKQNELMKSLTILSVVIAGLVGVALIWLGYLAVK